MISLPDIYADSDYNKPTFRYLDHGAENGR